MRIESIKMRYFLLFTCFMFVLFSVNAQKKLKTGDSEMDKNIMDIEVKANRDIRVFYSDLKITFHVSDLRLEYLKEHLKMNPAEIYLALEISKVSQKSLDEILSGYKSKRKKGWGYVASLAGIPPGSSGFLQIKSDIAKKSKEQKVGKISTTPKVVGGSCIMEQSDPTSAKDNRRNKKSY